ncbi:hypothetical protein OJ996_08135 [Luteolibacter sp. GHJ8]|uniref:Uncharacterized protein n=1 Tax=Luteolibacter rhizosphaerae TaxID=2989719 RepID=A0ABT3G1S7_9BACT|nr:hypothetical protein [Luteolibacter rhizosphaerae]MCW1913539.1 hypothetical protein [Luteolibacter rhizosphaerae]
MKPPSYLLLALAGTGLIAGFGIARLTGPEGEATGSPENLETAKAGKDGHRDSARGAGSGKPKLTLVKPAALPKSTDTVESLLQLNRGPLYARLGLWLLDASEEEMSAFWDGYHTREDPNDTIKDLLFTQWGKKNAAGMLEAAKRTGHEVPAMWSWAMSDPQGMLAYIEGKSDMMRNYGLRGLAYFHPELAQEMLAKDPALKNTFHIYEMAEQLSGGDPEKELEFLGKFPGYDYMNRSALKKWAAQDPHRAFDWLNQRGGTDDNGLRKEFFNTLKEEQPEVLASLAAGLPSGAMRREIEAAAFSHLAKTDPEKAAEEARKIDTPRLAAERFAELGKSMVAEQPEQALALLQELFEKCPDASMRRSWVQYPGGGGGGGLGVSGVSEFLTELTGWDPGRTLNAVMDLESRNSPAAQGPFYHGRNTGPEQVARQWARQDMNGLTTWTEAQNNPDLRDMGVAAVSYQLQQERDYEGAAEWATRLSQENQRHSSLMNTFANWAGNDRESARQWLDQAELPEQMRQSLQRYLPRTEP